MTHLTDEQLVVLLYRDEDQNHLEDNRHLENCPACLKRYQELVKVKGSLDSFEVNREVEVDVKAILDPAKSTLDSQGGAWTAPSNEFRFAKVAIAASILALVGGLSFLTGSLVHSQQTSVAIKEQVAKALIEMQGQGFENERQMNQELVREFQEHLTKLRKSLAAQDAKTSAQNLMALRNIETQFEALLVEQTALRLDLQTLAVNAEGEISSAQNDIRRINEFVSILLPPINN